MTDLTRKLRNIKNEVIRRRGVSFKQYYKFLMLLDSHAELEDDCQRVVIYVRTTKNPRSLRKLLNHITTVGIILEIIPFEENTIFMRAQ